MKKLIVVLALIVSATAYAQNDTTLINKPVKFEYETIKTKSGKETVKYYAIVDGKYYDSSKTATKRYYQTIKFGGKPNVAIVENKKKTNSKIIVL
ncbi:MAG: hypothetical protein J6M39_06730 [Lachnospiraceae bacterium]|nr:hypothetical protein [Lachnospiraceae bacterium]